MKSEIINLLLLMAISISSFSQDTRQGDIRDVSKLNFLNPGFSYEKRIGKFQSLSGQAFLNTSFSLGYSSSLGTSTKLSFDPAWSIQYRYYYNFNKRMKKEKRTEMNSLNYISPVFKAIYSKNKIPTSPYLETKARPINSIGAVWGLQRNYINRFSLDFNLGLGYIFSTFTIFDFNGNAVKKNTSYFSTIGQLNLGFWLNKRKRT